jgi:hypothetical protein
MRKSATPPGISSPPFSIISNTSVRPEGPVRVAWGKNNAAYMIIKMYKQDPTVDLAPAERLLEEGLDIPEAPEDCRAVLSANLAYVKHCLGRSD